MMEVAWWRRLKGLEACGTYAMAAEAPEGCRKCGLDAAVPVRQPSQLWHFQRPQEWFLRLTEAASLALVLPWRWRTHALVDLH